MLTRYFSSNRKILILSIITGLITALLLGSLQFSWSYHKREVKFDTLVNDVSAYMGSYFEDLKKAVNVLQPLTLNTCQDVNQELTSRAAFSINVRAFLLVRDKMAFCSSATGPMNAPMETLIPELNINKQIDMALLPGTPMLPNKPAIAIWYRNPLVKDGGVFTSVNLNLTPYLLYTARQDEFAGIALKTQATGDYEFAEQFENQYCVLSEDFKADLVNIRLENIPIDLRFEFQK